MNDKNNSINLFWRAAPWINKVIVLLSAAIFTAISFQPIVHPAAAAAEQGVAFTSSLGPTVFRVAFGGFPLGCAAFLVYCLLSSRRTLSGLIFSVLVLGVVLIVRVYSMEVDSSIKQSLPLVVAEIVLVAATLIGIAIEMGHTSYLRRKLPIANQTV
jgi:hypothetical protein